jgi:hypothetical protein
MSSVRPSNYMQPGSLCMCLGRIQLLMLISTRMAQTNPIETNYFCTLCSSALLIIILELHEAAHIKCIICVRAGCAVLSLCGAVRHRILNMAIMEVPKALL